MKLNYLGQSKNTPADPEDIRKEYEEVLREQRQRITSLRDENAVLEKKLAEYERYAGEITGALADARIKANDVIAAAKKRAAQIVAEADNAKKENDNTMQYYRNALKELECRSERILTSIQSELTRERTRTIAFAEERQRDVS